MRNQDKTGVPVCRVCSTKLTNDNWLACFKKQNYWKCQPCSRIQFNKNKKRWTKENPNNILLHHAKTRANKKNLDFNITIEDIKIPEYCPVLGIKLEHNNKKGSKASSPTLDRIVPNKGYIKGNVAVISHRANTIKNDATLEELRKVTKWLEDNNE